MNDTELLSPEKQQQILYGAACVFAQDGYEGASMARIASEAGVSKGTLYNYFNGKAELFRAFIEQECSRALAAMFAAPAPDESIEASLLGIGNRIVSKLLSEPGLVVYRIVISEAPKFPALARFYYEAGPARLIEVMARWLASEVVRGRLHIADPAFAAQQFFSLCQTSIWLQRRLHLVHSVPDEERERVVAAAVLMFLNTYGAPPRHK